MHEKKKNMRNNSIESFLTRVKDSPTMDRLGRCTFCMCTVIGLTIDKKRRAKFVNVRPTDQPFKEFKDDIINSLREYLRN